MLIPRAEIEDLKSRVDVVAVIGKHVPLKKQGKYFVGRCPFHGGEGGEKDPSFFVDPKTGLFNCLGACRGRPNEGGGRGSSGGDVFTFLMRFLKVDFREAGKLLGVEVRDGDAPRRQPELHAKSRAPRTAYLSRLVEHWQQELSINRRAQDYLESRGLVTKDLWRALKIGYSSGSVEELAGPRESEPFQQLVELSVLNEEGKERFKGRVVFPLLGLNQLTVGIYGRAIGKGHEPKHLYQAGRRQGLFNWAAARRDKELLIVESVICVVSLLEAQVTNAIPLCGLSIPPELFELIERFGTESIVLGLDGGEAGREATPRLTEAFRSKGLRVRSIEWPEKDPNEVLVGYGPKRLGEVVESLLAAPKARDLPEPAEIEIAAESTVTVAAIPLLIAESDPGDTTPADGDGAAIRKRNLSEGNLSDPPPPPAPDDPVSVSPETLAAPELTLTLDDRLWDVLWLESPSPAHLRARVKVFIGKRPPAPPTFLDQLNLLSSRSREGFARKAASLALPVSAPSQDILRLVRLLDGDLIVLAGLGEERRKASGKKEETVGAMTPQRRVRALSYLSSEHLLARVAEDIRHAGYVGEATVKVLGYLVAISRKLPEALSMVILSSSGSGKSALADVLEKLTPEEDLLVVTRFTAASLYWLGKDALKRKFVSIEERSGSQEADYSIRALQSKKKVTMMAPIKDQATGKIETRLFSVEGPVSFLESTTESQIHHENSTRCFEVRLDESAEQTKRIQDAQRFSKTFEGQRARVTGQEIADLHQDVQRLLRPVPVVIPFAFDIEFPTESIRTRRDNPRFLNLIEALAFLHQYQRPLTVFTSGQPCDRSLEELSDDELMDVRVEATLDDYASAYELASDLLYETLSELKKPVRAFYESIRELVEEESLDLGKADVSVLTREIRQRTRLPQHVVKRWIAELVELEYLAVTRGTRGASSAYRLVDLPEKKGGRIPGLLLPENLAQKLQEKRS